MNMFSVENFSMKTIYKQCEIVYDINVIKITSTGGNHK